MVSASFNLLNPTFRRFLFPVFFPLFPFLPLRTIVPFATIIVLDQLETTTRTKTPGTRYHVSSSAISHVSIS